MAVSTKVLIESKTMESASTTQYTAPTDKKAIIDTFNVTNYSASAANISVWLVPNGGSAGNDNLIIDNEEIQINESRPLYEIIGNVLNASGFIVTSGTASALSIRSSGRETTT